MFYLGSLDPDAKAPPPYGEKHVLEEGTPLKGLHWSVVCGFHPLGGFVWENKSKLFAIIISKQTQYISTSALTQRQNDSPYSIVERMKTYSSKISELTRVLKIVYRVFRLFYCSTSVSCTKHQVFQK